jgi:Gas vesicle protein
MEHPSRAAVRQTHRPVALCDALDRVLETGAVIVGEVMLTVADVDLIYLGFQLVLTSVADGSVPHLTNLLKDVKVTISEPEAARELP